MFEPDERAARNLESETTTYQKKVLRCALADTKGTCTFHLTKDQECSSCLRPAAQFLSRFPNPERFEVDRIVDIQCDTLDAQLETNGINPDFLKIDVQGFEYQILKGAPISLQQSVGVILEVEFAELYTDQHLFPDIHSLMLKSGYELFDLQRSHWKRTTTGFPDLRGQLLFANALYLRPPEVVIQEMAASIEKQLAAARIYCLFKYPDLIRFLSKNTSDSSVETYCAHLLSQLEQDCIKDTSASLIRRKTHGLLMRIEKLASKLRRKVLSVEYFGSNDPHLGNTRF